MERRTAALAPVVHRVSYESAITAGGECQLLEILRSLRRTVMPSMIGVARFLSVGMELTGLD